MLLTVARIVLALVFAVAALGKALDRRAAANSLRAFGVPGRLAASGAVVLPLAELAVAGMLLATPTARWGALGALVLLGGFIAAIATALARGRRPDCNCFGSLHSAPAGGGTLVRNGALAAVAAAILVAGPGDSLGGALDGVEPQTALLAGGVAVALAAHMFFTWQLFRQNGRLLVRVQALEAGTGTRLAGAAERQGLEQGVPAPAFSLPNLDGGRVSIDSLLRPGRKLALVFSDPGCGACTDLLPVLARTERERAGELDLALVSTGDAELNRSRVNGSEISTVLLQDGHEVATAYAAKGLPAAVLVDADGRIASPLAVGQPRIEALLGAPAGVELEVTRVGAA